MGDIYYIRLKFDYLRIGRDISESSKQESDEVDGSVSKLVVIKNLAIRGWHLWAKEASSNWCCACLFFYYKKKWGLLFYCKEKWGPSKNNVL